MFYASEEEWEPPQRDAAAKGTPQLTFHGDYGYSLGSFSEFFVHGGREPNPRFFKMGAIEGSFGKLTPLAQLLFLANHDDDALGELESYETVRLLGCTKDTAESAIISAILFLERETGLRCGLITAGQVEWPDEEEYDAEERTFEVSSAFSDVEPLRMLLRGRQERDPDYGFLQLYRVLEFFSVLTSEAKVEQMRGDRGLSTRQLLLELHALIGRDEKIALGRLLAQIADAALLQRARDAGLIGETTANALTNAIYTFRNSVVHAKADQQAHLFSESVFLNESKAAAWRQICEDLAWKAMTAFGTPLR